MISTESFTNSMYLEKAVVINGRRYGYSNILESKNPYWLPYLNLLNMKQIISIQWIYDVKAT